MRRLASLLGVLLAVGFAGSAQALNLQFHGDLNHRFTVYTDQANMFRGSETISSTPLNGRVINRSGVDESWAEIKYRLWVEAASDDGKIKGVYAIEVGATRFGDSSAIANGGTRGGAFSGDGINLETRWAYTDFQLPGVESKARFMIGLIPFSINRFLWEETVMGVQFKGAAGPADYTLAWARGRENFNDNPDDDLFEDLDALLARADFSPIKPLKAGLFALYEGRNPGGDSIEAFSTASQYQIKLLGNVDFDIFTLGTDGSWTLPTGFGSAFINWDLMYQTGSLQDNNAAVGDRDVSAYFAHLDAGLNIGKAKLTYTGWYASGDDNPADADIDNFLSTDVDVADSIVFFEGGYTDDNYFTEAPHFLDKGAIFNKLAVDFKATPKLNVGAAVIYAMTAEDLRYVDDTGVARADDKLGTEVDAYMSYLLYPNTEIALNAGYLFADDGMDFFKVTGQRNGNGEDVFRSTARLRYRF